MTRSLSDLLREARASVPEAGPADAELLVSRGARLIDVRERSEWDEGHIAGAAHVGRSYLEQQIAGVAPDQAEPLVLYCAGGTRSLFAAQTLQQMGYTDVTSMSGGFQAWKSAGMPWTTPVVLSREQKQRYSRHLLIPEVGAEGQAKLLGLEGAVHRRRRPGRSRPAVSRGGGRGHHRCRGLRHRRRVQPPAPGHPHHRSGGPEEDRIGGPDHPGAEPGCDRHPPRGDAHRGQRRPAHRGLRRDPRWHRHLRDPLHPQRRSRPGAHPRGPRLGLPVRRPAERVQAVRRSVLSVPVSHAAAARAGTRLLRRGCPGCRARRHGPAAGHGGDQGAAGHRGVAGRPVAHLRRPRRIVPGAAAAARPALPGVRRRRRGIERIQPSSHWE